MRTEGWSGKSIQVKSRGKKVQGLRRVEERSEQACGSIHAQYEREQRKIKSHLQEQDHGDRGKLREFESPFQNM